MALLLGNIGCSTEDEALFTIATALEIIQNSKEACLTEAKQKLISRNESDLSELIQKPKLSADDYISDMERLFKP